MSGVIDLSVTAGARAMHRYARLSASKLRPVLNLIRDADLDVARERLSLCERGAAEIVSKVLESAVTNAMHNEQLDEDELYVAECWADEGPVIKRWRARARGRSSRINKQTAHLTVIVAQLAESELELREARRSAGQARQSASAERAARVAASRAADTDATDTDATDTDATDTDATDTATEATADAGADSAAESEVTAATATADETAESSAEADSGQESPETANPEQENPETETPAKESPEE